MKIIFRKRLMLIFVSIVLLSGFYLRWEKIVMAYASEKEDIYSQVKLFTEVLTLIQDNYVDEVGTQDLIYGAMDGMVGTLDPFSQFLKPDESELIESETKGEFGGLGIRISMRDSQLTVVTPLPGTPAFHAGILPGDMIIKIEGETTQGITIMKAVKTLRGKPGTKVTITIAREGEKEPFDVTITRDIIKLESVPAHQARMVDEGIGYIRITEFNKQTPDDFAKLYGNLEEQGIKGLILDLRNNPGGLLTSAVDICKHLLGPNKLIVYTKGRDSRQGMKFYTDSRAKHPRIPLVVLVNKGSASGSEIVAGAVQDWKRGIILGEETFGKASVQSLIKLSSGASLRLTTARYYTPSGRSIHRDKKGAPGGIKPDIIAEISREDTIKLMRQQEKIYGLSEEQKAKREAKKIPDVQFDRAKELLKAQLLFNAAAPDIK